MSALAVGTRLSAHSCIPAGTPLIERVCSYCLDRLGWVVCVPENDGEQSHGACAPCKDKELAKLRAMTRLRTAAAYLRHEYTLEIGTAGEEPATQAATPLETTCALGAVNVNATEALRGPVSYPLSAAGGADEAEIFNGTAVGPTENAPDCGSI